MNANDNRKHPRFGISTEVEVQHSDRTIIAQAIDICGIGIGIVSSTSIQPGITAKITFPMSEEVGFYCTVIWTVRTSLPQGSEYRMGFSIEGMLYQGTIERDAARIDTVIQGIVSEFG